ATARQLRQPFHETFEAAARNFSELAGELFPGGSGQLRLVREANLLRPVLGGLAVDDDEEPSPSRPAIGASGADDDPEGSEPDAAGESGTAGAEDEAGDQGVEIEITPAGKWTKRLSLLSGGEK